MTVKNEKNAISDNGNILIPTQKNDKTLKSIKAKDFIETLLEMIIEDYPVYKH